MSDFDLVLRGNIVLSDRIIEEGYVAVSGGKLQLSEQALRPRLASLRIFAASGSFPV